MPTDRFAARRDKLIRELRAVDAEALLVTNVTNVTYLTGFTGDSSYLLIGRNVALLISDSRYTTQIEQECPGLDARIRGPQEVMDQVVGEVVAKSKLKKLGIEGRSLTVEQWQKLREKVTSVELVSTGGLVEKLRMVKDKEEISAIREAVREAERGFAVFRSSLLGEMTELQAAHDLEHAMRRFGAAKASFEPIVAVGERAALPHARPGTGRLDAADFVLVDWGASDLSGYKSDLTRVLSTIKIPPKLEKVYRVVLTAQQRAIEAIRPGAACRDIDAVARRVIDEAGFAGRFGHGLGHGIGLDIHEGPRLGPSSTDELKPGMVVTVEPGVYLPGWGGVRIEDDVLVTRDGCEILSSVTKDLHDLTIF